MIKNFISKAHTSHSEEFVPRPKEELLDGFDKACKEVKLFQEGKTKLMSFDDMMGQLKKKCDMECIISISQTFLLDVKRLRKKYKSIISDLDKFKEEISANPFIGSDLGKGLRKIRMGIASKGKGKRGGARIITYNVIKIENTIHIILLTMYDKSEQENISDSELLYLMEVNHLK